MLTTEATLFMAVLAAVGPPATNGEATVQALVDGRGEAELRTLAQADPATEATRLDQLRWWAGERLQEASRRQEVTPEPEGAEY